MLPIASVYAATPVCRIGATEYETLKQAFDAAQDGDTVIVISDIASAETITIPEGKTLTISDDGTSRTIKMTKPIFDVIGTLYISGTSDSNLIFDGTAWNGATGSKGKLATVKNNGVLNLLHATVNAGSLNNNKAGAITLLDNATFNMSGGILQNAKASAYKTSGIVVVSTNSIFNMTGGTIQKNDNNQSVSMMSGGVRIIAANANETPTFKMSGGTITENIGNMGGAYTPVA